MQPGSPRQPRLTCELRLAPKRSDLQRPRCAPRQVHRLRRGGRPRSGQLELSAPGARSRTLERHTRRRETTCRTSCDVIASRERDPVGRVLETNQLGLANARDSRSSSGPSPRPSQALASPVAPSSTTAPRGRRHRECVDVCTSELNAGQSIRTSARPALDSPCEMRHGQWWTSGADEGGCVIVGDPSIAPPGATEATDAAPTRSGRPLAERCGVHAETRHGRTSTTRARSALHARRGAPREPAEPGYTARRTAGTLAPDTGRDALPFLIPRR